MQISAQHKLSAEAGEFLMENQQTIEEVIHLLKKIGVPNDLRWQTLILYLRYIKEYKYLSPSQKEKVQHLLIEVIKRKKFDEEEYNRVMKELENIFFQPYKEKLKESVKETSELLKKFAEMSELRKRHVESLEQTTIEIIEKTDDISLSIEKIRDAFKTVISLIEEDIRRLYNEVKLDSLTSLYNRKFLDIYINKIINKCVKHKIPYCVIMFDIDFFKNINDKYGHRIGDQALVKIARIINTEGEQFLKKKGKGNFFASRYGGEEFCIILEGFEGREAKEFAENVRRRVEKYNFVIRDIDGNLVETGITITISAGVYCVENLDEPVEGLFLIEMADRALYMAKKGGRNRVVLYSEQK